jgi:hypothetical protein
MAEEEQLQSAPAAAPRPKREEYETVKLETVNYGTNNFIEIAKKKAPNGNLFISVSKGWYPAGSSEKRYKAGIGFPMETELVNKVLGAFDTVLKE